MDNQLKTNTSDTPQVSSTLVDKLTITPPSRNTLPFILLIVLFSATIFGLGGFYLGRNSLNFIQVSNKSNQYQNTTSTIVIPTETPSPTQALVPSPKPGFKVYTDEELKYGFSYPDSLSLSKCRDIPCAAINTISLKIQPLKTFQLSPQDPKASLLANDLHCDAGGPMGSIECKNTKVDDFTNSLGFKGYKIYRTKIFTGTNTGVYQDVAYVFSLQKVVKGQGLPNFAGILFAVDTTTQSNLASLDEISNSFFNY